MIKEFLTFKMGGQLILIIMSFDSYTSEYGTSTKQRFRYLDQYKRMDCDNTALHIGTLVSVQIIYSSIRTVRQTVQMLQVPFVNHSSCVHFWHSNGFPLLSVLPFRVTYFE